MTVPAQTPVSTHVGNGVTTTFAYAFKLLDQADIRVSVDGVLKTITTDYSVTGVGVDAGGTIVFVAAPANLASIELLRSVTPQRLTDYQYSGDFQSPTVNRDFDRVVMMVQDKGLTLDNSVRFPAGDLASPVLPNAAARALKGMAFDADGDIFLTTAAGDANALAAQLASSATAALGGGQVGYDAGLAYGVGTAGKGIKDAAADAAAAAADAADVAADLAASFPVANANLGTMAAATIKGRASGAGTGVPVDLTAAQARTILNGTAWDLAAGTADLQKAVSGGASPQPALNLTITDTLAIGSAFYLGAAFLINRTGGTGHREAATARITSNSAPASEFCVGFHGLANIQTGSGNAFGLNGYAWVDAAAAATAELCGAEMNTDARRSVARKVGLQIVDVATSTGAGTSFDAGIIIGSQAGANGYSVGLQFGFDGTTGFGVQSGGTLISAKASATSFRAGIDLEGLSTYTQAAILLRPNTPGIWFGTSRAGGSVQSEVATSGGRIALLTDAVRLQSSAAATIADFTPTESYLMVVRTTGGSVLKRVIADAADTAGAGYRNLKVEN